MRVIRTGMPIPTACFAPAICCAALLLTACGTGGIGDVYGRRGDPTAVADDLRGTVESVSTRDRVIIVSVDDAYRSGLRDRGYGEVELFYDDRTIVQFEGRSYRPEDLERGDRIAAAVGHSGSRLVADKIEVLYDVTSGRTATGASTPFGEVRGEVRFVDTRDRTIELEDTTFSRGFDPGGRGDVVVVHYDASTVVEYQGRRYSPESLERGDQVAVEVRDLGNRLVAEEIVVVGDVRGGL